MNFYFQVTNKFMKHIVIYIKTQVICENDVRTVTSGTPIISIFHW